MSQPSTTYTIVFSGRNMVKPVVEEIKNDINTLRNSTLQIQPSATSLKPAETITQPAASPAIATPPPIQQPTITQPTLNMENNQKTPQIDTSSITAAAEGMNNLNTQVNTATDSFAALEKTGSQAAKNTTSEINILAEKIVICKTKIDNTNDAFSKSNERALLFFNNSLRGFQMLAFGMQMTIFTFSMLESRELALQNYTDQLAVAQKNYNAAIREYGRNSEQAQTALMQLEKVQRNYESASKMSTLMTVSMALQLASLGTQIIQFIPTINTLITSMKALTVWQTISSALSGNWVKLIAGIGISAAALGSVAYIAGKYGGEVKSESQRNVNVNVNVDTGQDVYKQYIERSAKVQVTSIGG